MSELTDLTPAERHRTLASRFLEIADGVDDWDAPTPVKEWTNRDVVAHLTWLPGMLAGMGVELDVPQHDDPVEQLRAQTEVVQERLDGPDGEQMVETGMMGQLSFSQVIDRFYNFDLFAHAWDLAKGSGQEIEVDEDYSAGAHAGMSAMGPALHASGQFGSPQPVADDAPASDRLLALIGRDRDWRADSR
ncbi:maleylpyruvate isomerase family mycothiol-dependent enzyme [Ornithinimicrobium sp. Y1847]|uniref:maleylpyruvate isomerase family mycothiol-dependent enzyme n=1 Tax=Ornithinimicrobium sp. Y1847 TaxID=3405419 RepID=UPI003B6758F3